MQTLTFVASGTTVDSRDTLCLHINNNTTVKYAARCSMRSAMNDNTQRFARHYIYTAGLEARFMANHLNKTLGRSCLL